MFLWKSGWENMEKMSIVCKGQDWEIRGMKTEMNLEGFYCCCLWDFFLIFFDPGVLTVLSIFIPKAVVFSLHACQHHIGKLLAEY